MEKCFRVAISESRVYDYYWWTKEVDPPGKPRTASWWTMDLPSFLSLPIPTSGMTNRKWKVPMKPSAGTLARRESSAFLSLHLKRTSDIWTHARVCSARNKISLFSFLFCVSSRRWSGSWNACHSSYVIAIEVLHLRRTETPQIARTSFDSSKTKRNACEHSSVIERKDAGVNCACTFVSPT